MPGLARLIVLALLSARGNWDTISAWLASFDGRSAAADRTSVSVSLCASLTYSITAWFVHAVWYIARLSAPNDTAMDSLARVLPSKRVRSSETRKEENFVVPYNVGLGARSIVDCTQLRRLLGIDVNEEFPFIISSFFELNGVISSDILRTLADRDFDVPTSVQKQCIPAVLAGRDVVCLAETGSGKTLGYLLPMTAFLARSASSGALSPTPLALVVVPTRELAEQVHLELASLLAAMGPFRAVLACGGVAAGPQIAALQLGAQAVIATPGRLLDLVQRGALVLATVGYFVIDEADRMLDLSMESQLRAIVALLPTAGRQSLLCSATMPIGVERLARSAVLNPLVIRAGAVSGFLPGVEHDVREMLGHDRKDTLLLEVLRSTDRPPVIVFCNASDTVDRLVHMLRDEQFHAAGMHGEHTQHHRFRVMALMRRGACDVMVTTDLVARGIDIADVSRVVNYDMPPDITLYVHRAGRTGRAGAVGTVTSFAPQGCALVKEIRGIVDRQSKSGSTAYIKTERQ